MNRNDVIRMAREAGYFLYDLTETHGKKTVETDDDDEWAVLERFAALVAAHEREACAKVCDEFEMSGHDQWERTSDPEAQGKYLAAADCATAIRKRGEK